MKMLEIKKFLQEKGTSQAQAARDAGINASSLNRIVNGKEPAFPKRAAKIAEAIGWDKPISELFKEVEV